MDGWMGGWNGSNVECCTRYAGDVKVYVSKCLHRSRPYRDAVFLRVW